MKVCPCGKAFACHEDTCKNKFNVTTCLCPNCLTKHRLAFQGKPRIAILLNECFKGIKQGTHKRKTTTRYDEEMDVLYTNFYTPPSLEADFTHRMGDYAMRYKDGKLIGITHLNVLHHCKVKSNKISLKLHPTSRLDFHEILVDGERIGSIWDNGDDSVSIRVDPKSWKSGYRIEKVLPSSQSNLVIIKKGENDEDTPP